jgi:hypothetical protein
MNITRTLDFDFEDIFEAKHQKEDREIEYKEDPLLLSCCAKSVFEKGGRYRSFEDESLLDMITGEHRAHAHAIRKYFSKKFFWKNLENSCPLSPFRQRVLFLLESKTKVIKEKDTGIFYKLPYFYEEDQVYERFKKELKTGENFHSSDRSFYTEQKRSLEYLEKTIGWQGKDKIVRYWFKDQDQCLYNFVITEKNPLKDFFTGFIEQNSQHEFVCKISTARIENMNFYMIIEPKLSKE